MLSGLALLSIRRPVAVSMFFLGLVLLGGVAWQRMPVELFPAIRGDQLFVSFARPGSEPETVEREILLPLEARVGELPNVAETWGEVVGSAGRFRIRFEKGTELEVRELELRRIAAQLARDQPRGAFLDVSAEDTSAIAGFAMMLAATGAADRNTLHDLVQELVVPRLAAVTGVSQALALGGAGRQVTVLVDPDRCAALGVTTREVTDAVRAAAGRLRFLGSLEDESGRTAVMLDGRPAGPVALGEVRVTRDRPVLVRHVAEIEIGPGRERSLFRLDGEPSVGLILFQEEGANLVRVGRSLRQRISEVNAELEPLGIGLDVRFDGAELVEEQIGRLAGLGLSGFAIALTVLFLFLRQWRAVAVVAVAVPVSLLAALAMLFVAGQSLNLITLFGLAVGVGLLVDNSVVVYEAVQRQLEHGAPPDQAALGGVRRTARAILSASATTAVVFLPPLLIDLEQSLVTSLIEIVALAILLPLFGSLLVALALVPLLARHLAAPAALRRLEAQRERRARHGGLVAPDRAQILFSGILASALRRPSGWITGVVAAILLTAVVAIPWVLVNSTAREAPRAEQVQLSVRLAQARGSLDASVGVFERLEGAAMAIDGVESVESAVREEGGTLTIHLAPLEERPRDADAAKIRQAVRRAASELRGVQILRPEEAASAGSGGDGTGGGAAGPLGGQPAKIVLSGPESDVLSRLASDVVGRLEVVSGVQNAWPALRPGPEEIRVTPNRSAFEAFGLQLADVLPVLDLAGREGSRITTGYPLPSGRELPIVVQRAEAALRPAESAGGEARPGSAAERRDRVSVAGLSRLRVPTASGVLPVAALADVRRVPAPPVISHHNGRREREVFFALDPDAPRTGPARVVLDREITSAIRDLHRPPGVTIELDRTTTSTDWFRRIAVPVVLLLYLVLATTFESLTLPFLILLSLPLTLLGAVWALVLAGLPMDMMAMVGALALFGLTVNPAILLVDRMQQRALGANWSGGAAALAAVRERARPVLMTTATTVAALWPLAVQTGRENEIWPPFATLVIGGLLTSTLLTLLVVPVGFVFLRRLDLLFGRVGPWVVLAWIAATVAVLAPLFLSGVVSSLLWQTIILFLVAGGLLGLTVLLAPREPAPEPAAEEGPPRLDVRALRKVYGLAGPVRRALRAPFDFAERVQGRGGVAFDPADARDRLVPLLLLGTGAVLVALRFQGLVWQLFAWLAAGGLAARFFLELRRARGRADGLGRVEPGGVAGKLAVAAPWIAFGIFAWRAAIAPRLADEGAAVGVVGLVIVAVVLLVAQLGRRTARALSQGTIEAQPRRGTLRRARTAWRALCRRLFGLDLPTETVEALAAVDFEIEGGMVGVLGPNGAGKTTLLRQLAGVLDSTRGRIFLGGVPLLAIRRHLARWVGYLPQDAGLPKALTAREYLEYYAALYQIPARERRSRIESLLDEVGLRERAGEPIGGYSGGMRQRVAVARTLLRLPPVIVVDEPTVGLDPRERVRFRNLLSRLAKDRIVLFSTHVVEDVAVACERVLVLRRGRLVFDGEPSGLSARAAGRVWTWSTTPEEEPELPADAVLADQVPSAEGGSRLRVLSELPPDPRAEPAEPTLEDGYLWLVRGLDSRSGPREATSRDTTDRLGGPEPSPA